MLDIKLIREHTDTVKTALANRGQTYDIEGLLSLDTQYRGVLRQTEELKAQRNKASEEIGQMVRAKQDIAEKRKSVEALNAQMKTLDDQAKDLFTQIQNRLFYIPNIPHKSVPLGTSATQNVQVKEWGTPRTMTFPARNHMDLAAGLDSIDFPRAAKLSGAGFSLYKGKGARLERALINFMLDLHTRDHGYTEIFPPFLVNRAAMMGTGQLPKFEEDMYRLKEEDLFLIPTAEVPVTNILANEILKEEDLPIYYTGYSACFRREAGSYGADTKGLKRVHQFNKVELVKFTSPETSYEEHEKLLVNAERVLQLLELPYRVILLCTGDMSFSAAKCYDLEVWAAGAKEYLEVSSCSNFEDFQARRANIRYRRKKDNKLEFVHTLNSSGVATPRTMIALLEHYQNADGSITIPSVLRPYMDGADMIKK